MTPEPVTQEQFEKALRDVIELAVCTWCEDEALLESIAIVRRARVVVVPEGAKTGSGWTVLKDHEGAWFSGPACDVYRTREEAKAEAAKRKPGGTP